MSMDADGGSDGGGRLVVTWLDLYIAHAESIAVTQRWLDWEIQRGDEPTTIDALKDLLASETRFLLALEAEVMREK
jgi:hypothetical protein